MPKAAYPDRFGRYRLGLDGVLRKPQGRASSPTVAIVTLRPRKQGVRAEAPVPVAAPVPAPAPTPEPTPEAAEQPLTGVSEAAEEAPAPVTDVAKQVREIIARSEKPKPATSKPTPKVPARSKYGPGEARPAKAPGLPEIPFHLRKRNIEAATAVLKQHAILVDVVDRNALVRTYRVSGKRDAMLAEGVIEIACQHGFEVIL